MATNSNVTLSQLQTSVSNIKNFIDQNKDNNGIYVETLLDNVPLSEFLSKSVIDGTTGYTGYYNLNRLLEKDNYNNIKYNYYFIVQTLESDNTLGHMRFLKLIRNDSNILGISLLSSDGNTSSSFDDLMRIVLTDHKKIDVVQNEDGTTSTVTSESDNNSFFQISISKYDIIKLFEREGYTADIFLQTKITVKLFIIDQSINTVFPIYGTEDGGLTSISNLFSDNTLNKIERESLSLGLDNIVNNNSLSIGNSNNVGKFSSVFGYHNILNGLKSSVIGQNNNITASSNAHIYGDYLNATESYTFTIGKYGNVPSTLMFALCNGTSETDRKVIFGVDRTGLAITEAVPTEDSHLTNKKYVDDRFVNIDIASTLWNQNVDNGLYELTYTHNLASENITVQVYNTDSKYEMFVDTQIVDSNSIKITSDENPNCAIRIVKF